MSAEQIPFGENAEFADNPEPRCPCALLLDTSGSMRGQPVSELNQAIRTFKDELMGDEMAANRLEVAIIGFRSIADSNRLSSSRLILQEIRLPIAFLIELAVYYRVCTGASEWAAQAAGGASYET
jgi:hypothetical protein